MSDDYWSVFVADLALSLATELKACMKCVFRPKCGLFAGHSGDAASLKLRARFGPLLSTLLISCKSCVCVCVCVCVCDPCTCTLDMYTHRSWTLLYDISLSKR